MAANLAQQRTREPSARSLPLTKPQPARHVNICVSGGYTRPTTPPLATLEVDNLHTGTPVKTCRIKQGDDSSFGHAPRQFRSPEDRVATRKTSLLSRPLVSGDVDSDPFAPTYTLTHASPLGLITSSATPPTYDEDEDEDPEDELKQQSPSLTSSPHPPPPRRPPVSRSVSPGPVSPAPSDDQMDEDIENTPDYAKLPYKGFAASGPEDHAGVPFQKHSGGGAGLPRTSPNSSSRSLVQEASRYPPTPHEKGDFAGHVMYHPPWVLVGKCGSKEVRDELARHQLIACSLDLVVHVLKVDLLRMSWLLGHWRCNTLVPIPPAVLRAAVATATFSQGPIRTTIVHATQNEEGTADEQVYRFVQTLDAACLPSAAEPPLWVVYGKPCSESHAIWESIRDLFQNASFTKGLSEFTPIGSPSRSSGSTTRHLALCYICKLNDHRSDTCPYALLPDWLGPNEVIKEGREGVLALTPDKPQTRNSGARNNDRNFRRNQRPRRD
ncbi:hypothetical protein B0H14DRAFT_2587788 [Mycena olivaceomarginata]|nr:hypothetical protein B0H14DRAFT_2587788 [Mycena olivaceomarginata]